MRKMFRMVLPVILIIMCLAGCTSEKKKAAITDFDKEITRIETQIEDFNTIIKECEELTKTEKIALDETLRPALETAISTAKVSVAVKLPEAKGDAEEINKQTEELKKIDLEPDKKLLLDSKAAFEKSLKQYELVTNPSEAYVIKRLTGIEHISDISAVTEDNDPNGNLNKPGGYTATVYYRDDRLNLDPEIYGKTVIEQGTNGGGAIEVYATVEDAEKRRDYLATFDGTITASGTHTVIVRTSNKLKASEQKDMEAKLIETLTYVEQNPKNNTITI